MTLDGPQDGNPFLDVEFGAVFENGTSAIEVAGFYDGAGVYRVRFMPDATGVWRFATRSNRAPLAGQRGEFTVTAASGSNHGPVRIVDTYHFACADGTRFLPIGTTCYSWTHRPESMQEETLRSLAQSPFNKLRMCVFPQKFGSAEYPPEIFPFEGTPPQSWNFERFNPEFFRRLERRIAQLRDLGIECDLILFHPYDGGLWGFDRMDAATDDRYLRYVVARLATFRNIWWSLANEYDFMSGKSEADWDRLFQIVRDTDPYTHLRSIHNGNLVYNNTHAWVTHASIQDGAAVAATGRADFYRRAYRKPVVYDEVCYEGNFEQRWAQLSGRELIHRFWCGMVAGTYVGHSEFFVHPENVVWLAHGVRLHGESPERIRFLRRLLEEAPQPIEPIDRWSDVPIAGRAGAFYFHYLGRAAPKLWPFELPENNLADGMEFRVEVIDPWAMTITPVDGAFVTQRRDRYTFEAREQKSVALPGESGLVLRIRHAGGASAPGAPRDPTP